MNDENPREENDETIPLSQEQDARFSGNRIIFPTRADQAAPPAEEVSPSRDRAPIEDRSAKPKRSFLSFFDAPQTEEETGENAGGAESPEPEAGGGEDADDLPEEETLSFDEFVQNEIEEERQEDLDNFIRQNDADSLFALGEKYDGGTPPADTEGEDEVVINPTSILEAMLFVGNRENKPLEIGKAISLMRNVTRDDALKAVEELNRRYTQTGAPYQVVRNDEHLTLELRGEYEPVRQRFFSKPKDVKLSQKAIDVLALVAYRQPISAAEIQEVRPQCATILKSLLKRDLIRLDSAGESGAAPVYRTTNRLLNILGIKTISDLPIVDELDYR